MKQKLHFLFFIIPGVFYFLTASRTPGWVDAALIVSNVINLQLGSWVNTHNLFNLLGNLWLKLFPADNIHFYLVLLSALLGTLTVYFIFLTGLEMTGRPLSAMIGALVLMVSHSLWWHSAMLEVYTLNTALMAVMFYLVVRYNKTERSVFLHMAAFFFGLSCSNHVLMGLFVAAFLVLTIYILVQRKGLTVKRGLLLFLCFVLGLSLYLFTFTRDLSRNYQYENSHGESSVTAAGWNAFKATLHNATGGHFKEFMFTENLPSEQRRFWRFNYLFLFFGNFPSPALPLGLFGLFLFWKKKKLRLTFLFYAAAILAQAVWSANYFIWDMYAFSLPVYVLFSIAVILGINWFLSQGAVVRRIFLVLVPTLLLPVLIYHKVPDWYSQGGFMHRYFNSYREVQWAKHTWEPAAYIGNPNKRRFDKVEKYVNKLFTILPQDAHFLTSDARSDYPLRYYYRGIYSVRTDINYHHLFSLRLPKTRAKEVAGQIERALENNEPVYTASVAYPEKEVLDQLYLIYDPDMDVKRLNMISQEEYVASFPGFRIEKIVLFEDEEIWIYKLILEIQ